MGEQNGLAGTKVFISGGNGFIGRRLVAALAAAGAEVTALSRGGSVAGAAQTITGGLTDRAALTKGLAGQAVLFHLAYDVRASAADNLAGFETLLAAATEAGVGRIVHTSSIVVYDGWPDSDLTEDSPMERPGGSPYRQAKIGMERQLLAGNLPAAILQPTIVWGPGSALWTDALAEALTGGDVVLPEPEGVLNGVFVDDLVQALLKAAQVPDLTQERFIISGLEGQTWRGLIEGYAAAIGQGKVRLEPHHALAAQLGPKPPEGEDAGPSAAARVSAIARRLLGRDRFEALVRQAKRRLSKGGDFTPDHHLLEVFSGTGRCAIDRAQARLDYAPQYGLAEGLAATAPYLKDRLT
ncbi:NAD-dependent epimerase/dehydratase family protein [Fluviibacterium sp. DFM31]|uniref:NAD-dependent epimerase/dehydratase family protein n=1 Tax=Meridianimarinicoccus marinus TaxID=3231483 RepID=A0ABV3L5W1_9RHOB